MKTPKFSESKIFQILKEAERGVAVPDLCRKYGMSSASFYNWRSKDGSMGASSMKRLSEIGLPTIASAVDQVRLPASSTRRGA